jgi:hypothetical protein
MLPGPRARANGSSDAHPTPAAFPPVMTTIFDFFEGLYDRRREIAALKRTEKTELVRELLALLGVDPTDGRAIRHALQRDS